MVELNINDTTQYILIEGTDTQKPVILFLHGGPGQPLPFGVSSRGVYKEITEHFLAVYYDQRGAGKSYQNDIPIHTMNINQYVEDTNEVVDYLRQRFSQNKIYVAGMSWGSIIGMKFIHHNPEKVQMYFGISQFVSNAKSQTLSTKWLLETADDNKVLEELASFGTAPYSLKDEEKYTKYISKYGGDNYSDKTTSKVNVLSYLKPMFFSPDYTLRDIYKVVYSGAKFSLFDSKELQKEIQFKVDLQEEVKSVKVPFYLFQGRHDKLTNYEVTKEFFTNLEGHVEKELITLEKSAHYPNKEDFTIFIKKVINLSK
ncbi:alpha/beta fold hydrolase [Sporosarcina sp. Te-1]|uniref:alpha/beta fold hydrolase n=1 Tax=Sporosarcina sp. Te-1 TaxID=2818390 RepID=UPI001A9FB575|nr:alpha/beta fold hydrolase [Sporosarcina sp. Te-1]QTD41843.1 alpha/beta hydrolase [Sporosarcina sp. Te-1]